MGFHISPFAHDIFERYTNQPSKFHRGASFCANVYVQCLMCLQSHIFGV